MKRESAVAAEEQESPKAKQSDIYTMGEETINSSQGTSISNSVIAGAGDDVTHSNHKMRRNSWTAMNFAEIDDLFEDEKQPQKRRLRYWSCKSCFATCRAWCREHRFILAVSISIFLVLLAAGLSLCLVFMNAHEEELRNEALDIAEETGAWFSNQLDQAILPLFSMAQFAVELPIFSELPKQIGPAGEPDSLPLLPPYADGGPLTHRNVTGVCDEPDLVQRFTEIAATIKEHAGMQGVLVNLQLAPQAVVCLLHPLVNTEDFENGIVMNNTAARGLDLLVDPFSSFIAKQSIPQNDVIVAGPLTLRQCSKESDCDATVEKAFIARLPIAVDDYEIEVDGIEYPKWGFATALINWEALVSRSDIYESFEHRQMTFQLTRTDRTFVETSGGEEEYTEKVVVLAETPNFQPVTRAMVSTALQTTNNEWEMTVVYNTSSLDSTKTGIIVGVVIVAAIIATMVFVVLQQRQTQLKMLGATLQQQTKVETERNMTAYFAHELRNPLGAIDSALVAMPQEELSESTRELVAGMTLCSSFMSSIMNNLLDVRKMEEGKMSLQQEPLSLSRLNATVHAMLLPAVKQGVVFIDDCQISPDADWVLGDVHRLQQVMTNIITNAIKYTTTGSITLRMSWQEEADTESKTTVQVVKFECIDTGPGIPKEEQEQMFERFVQRRDSHTHPGGGSSGGSGLGLAISKHIVTLVGGSIHFESDPTVRPGTNCIVRMPLARCDPPQVQQEVDVSPILETIRVLIVDDVKMNRMMLQRRIQKGVAPNCEVTEAATGEEALELLVRHNNRDSKDASLFDVIVIDQYMEEAGGKLLGTQVVQKMRQSLSVDCIIVGSSGNEMDTEFLQAGADWVWQKPIPPNAEIIPKLRHALAERQGILQQPTTRTTAMIKKNQTSSSNIFENVLEGGGESSSTCYSS